MQFGMLHMSAVVWFAGAMALGMLGGCSEADRSAEQSERAGPAEARGAAQESAEGESLMFSVTLTGAAQAPGPGDEDGTGTAQVMLDPANGELCYDLTVEGIEPATAAHIHAGVAGEAGGVVVPLEAPTEGSSNGCVEVEAAVLRKIAANPTGYYINVHNADFPAGAIRGQLAQ